MTTPPETGSGPAAGARRETSRIRLARVAVDAASRHPGVAAPDAGALGRRATFAGRERLPGVVVAADGDPGRYAVALYLRAELCDLRELADGVRAAVRSAAGAHGLAEHLGEVRIAITDIDDGTPSA